MDKIEENFIKAVTFINEKHCNIETMELIDFLQENDIPYIYFENIEELFDYYNEETDENEHFNVLSGEYCLFCEDNSIFKLTY